MSSKKQITIDPVSLSGGQPVNNNNTTLKRQRKIKPPAALLRPSTVKKNLLEKIKNYKRQNEETPSQEHPPLQKSDKDLANQFKMSSNYLEQLINKKKEARKHHPHKPKTPPTTMQPLQVLQQPLQQPLQEPLQALQQLQQPLQQPLQHPLQALQQPLQQALQQPLQALQQVQVSLDLPPELQLNPVNSFYPTPIVDNANEPSGSEQFTPPSNPSTNPNVLKDVPYGCLRNGIKPTYRTYHREMQKHNPPDNNNNGNNNNGNNKTMKRALGDAPNPNNQLWNNTNTNTNTNTSNNNSPESDEMIQIQERQRKLRELQERAAINNATNATDVTIPSEDNQNQNQISRPMKIKNKIRQTITKKYNLGRVPGSNVVGVLIKNSETRRQIQQEHGVLRRESIVEIRKYLHDHGLLKVGSDAPPDVLRNMYENAKLTGDVNNVNKHVMLHNFIATADSTNDAR
jgi:hypothetical protein